MKNGRFTKEERDYLISLDAVKEIRIKSIIYAEDFKSPTRIKVIGSALEKQKLLQNTFATTQISSEKRLYAGGYGSRARTLI